MAYYQALPWHEGEDKIHQLTRSPRSDNPTHPMLSGFLANRVAASPTIALGTIDDEDNVWCTVWGGDLPIAQQVAAGGVIGIKAPVDATFDPVVETLYGGKDDGEVLKCEGNQRRMVSGLSIHLEDRDRVKLFGRMVAGCLDATENAEQTSEVKEAAEDAKGTHANKTGAAQLVLHITQSLGNCPKYINKRSIKSHLASRPQLAFEGSHLSAEAIAHIHSCDIFFIASRGPEDMDCNHRGGTTGFLRVQPQAADSDSLSTIVWPEYSGNNLYQTLGNILHNPTVGLCVPNFITGDVLYLTGKAEILLERAAIAVISKSKLAVQMTVSKARFVKQGLMFRGTPSTDNRDSSSSNPTIDREITDGMSPYNPRVRYLTSELDPSNPNATFGSTLPPDEYRRSTFEQPALTAKLTRKNKLTPTITRYTFRLSSSDPNSLKSSTESQPLWKPGQYVALDFSEELYMGYSHMNDSEPTSINDDYIRTFTVASRYKSGAEPEFDMVVRNVGVVTRWLSRQNDRSGMTELKVLGFGGDLEFESSSGIATVEDVASTYGGTRNVFIAAGIGVTPLLGQLSLDPEDRTDNLSVLWTFHIRDVGLAIDILPRLSQSMRSNTRIFVTGTQNESADSEDMKSLDRLQSEYSDVKIERRRLTQDDVMSLDGTEKGGIDKWFVCTAPAMRKEVQGWLGSRTILFENFDY